MTTTVSQRPHEAQSNTLTERRTTSACKSRHGVENRTRNLPLMLRYVEFHTNSSRWRLLNSAKQTRHSGRKPQDLLPYGIVFPRESCEVILSSTTGYVTPVFKQFKRVTIQLGNSGNSRSRGIVSAPKPHSLAALRDLPLCRSTQSSRVRDDRCIGRHVSMLPIWERASRSICAATASAICETTPLSCQHDGFRLNLGNCGVHAMSTRHRFLTLYSQMALRSG